MLDFLTSRDFLIPVAGIALALLLIVGSQYHWHIDPPGVCLGFC